LVAKPVAEVVAKPVAEVTKPVAAVVAKPVAAVVKKPVAEITKPVAAVVKKPVAEVKTPVAGVKKPVATAAPAAPTDRQTALATRPVARFAAPTQGAPTEGTATKGGADPSEDVDQTRAETSSGLGSSTVERRQSGVEDGQRTGAAADPAVPAAPPAVVIPPVLAPPFIAAPETSPAFTRGTRPSAARTPRAATRLRYNARRREGPPLVPGARRSLAPTASARHVAAAAPARRAERRTPAGVQTLPAAPEAPAASAGGALSGLSVPPPAAAYALLAAALVVMAVYFSVLLALPAHRGSVPFISLLERPG
jgi:hypothetical protein